MNKELRVEKKFFIDLLLNLSASSIPLLFLQLLIYPKLAIVLGDDGYGLMVSIHSLWIVVSQSMGNVLNNVRLLRNDAYLHETESGDFPVILQRWALISSAIIASTTVFFYQTISVSRILLAIAATLLILIQSYTQVEFRIKLEYRGILISNLLLCGGYFAGLQLVKITGIWEFLYFAGYFASGMFCVFSTHMLREPKIRTQLYSSTARDCKNLLVSNTINNAMNYADKMILYPLMGGPTVSIYYTATILGKFISMLVGPFNSVMLSYISKWEIRKKKQSRIILVVAVAVAIVGYIATMVVAQPFLRVFFPQWLEPVMKYLPVTTITVALNVISSVISPMVLKFCNSKWQIFISSLSLFVYLVAAMVLFKFYGLFGFCVGVALGTATRLGILTFLYYKMS